MMKFGLFEIAQQVEGRSSSQIYGDLLDEMVLAEELGFDTVFFAEHHFSDYSVIPSPNLLVASLAQKTKRIRIGTLVNVLPFHHPVRLAEEGAMLDMISDGRLLWGIGRGIQPGEFIPWRVDRDQSREIFEEVHDATIRAWTQPTFSYEGRFIHIPETSLVIRPVQKPHPPIWVAGLSEPSVRWAARHNYLYMEVYTTLPTMQQHWEIYQEEASTCGHTIHHVGFVPTRHIYLAATDEQAKAEALPTLATRWKELLRLAKPDEATKSLAYSYLKGTFDTAARGDFNELMDLGMLLIGSPETCIRQIKRHQEFLGEALQYVILFFAYGNLTQKQVLNSMRLFAEEVMPEFADTPVSTGVSLQEKETRSYGA